MERLLNALCHPKKIGFYFKDKAIVVFSFLMLMIAFSIAGVAVNSYAYPQFDYNTATSITALITGSGSKTEYNSETHILTGAEFNKEVYTAENFTIAFYTTDTAKTQNSYSILFAKEYVYLKYQSIIISKIKYSDLNINSFKVSEIQSSNAKRIEFTDVIFKILNASKTNFANFNFIVNSSSVLMYAVFLIIANLIFSYFTNPTIQTPVRFKLLIYTSLIYFLFSGLAFFSGVAWLEYVGLFLSVIYTNICFRHIIRVS